MSDPATVHHDHAPPDMPPDAPAPSVPPAPQAGPAYWRSLDELADTPQFRSFVQKEFPGLEEELSPPAPAGSTRRTFLKLMAASFALAGLAGLPGCRRWPQKKLAPHGAQPEGFVPGQAEYYATAFELAGVAQALLVKSFDGRPIKIEGNPEHPASQGAASLLAQASILSVYDPQRSRGVQKRGPQGRLVPAEWAEFEAFLSEQRAGWRTSGGAGLAVLAQAGGALAVESLRQRFAQVYPQARWFEYEPVSDDHERAGTKLAFGAPHRPILDLDQAEVIVCLDADILGAHPDALRLTRQFAQRRRSADTMRTMNRLYVAESTYSITGTMADHRLAMRSGFIAGLAWHLAHALGVPGVREPGKLEYPVGPKELEGLVNDLKAHAGRGLVVAGQQQPPIVHALAAAINAHLGNAGKTVRYAPLPDRPAHARAIADLAADLNAGKVQALLILGGNPVYDAPADVEFAKALAQAPVSIHLGLYADETAQACAWHVNQAHYLEGWGDARAFDGTLSIVQPLILPLFDGKTSIELLAWLLDEKVKDGYELVRQAWKAALPANDYEKAWRRALHDGLLRDSAWKTATPAVRSAELEPGLGTAVPQATGARWELVLKPDYRIHDGRFANNGWLQELPDPITKVVWDNALLMAPADAAELNVAHGDMVKLTIAGGAGLEAAVYVLPGQARGSVALSLGYGRRGAGSVGDGLGFNAFAVRGVKSPWITPVTEIRKLGRAHALVTTQDHHAIDKVGFEARGHRVKEFVRELPLAEYLKSLDHAAGGNKEAGGRAPIHLQLWDDPVRYKDDPAVEYMWGMAIDLTSCIGCNACVIACQAENNIPIVGKQQVGLGRAMHWIRIDRYFQGTMEDALSGGGGVRAVHQPVACVHCETAPCEQVCPVAATVHSHEGLNTMVYNRCVGTRYCSNNCPYKVRRFNYLDWHAHDPRRTGPTPPHLGMPDQQPQTVDPVTRMRHNPDVTVRSRGVMEKCTYCVQRIEAARVTAKNAGRKIADGEVTPACAQTCPAQAITFGNLKDPSSKVSKLQAGARAYGLLAELNVRPRTQYLVKITNRNG